MSSPVAVLDPALSTRRISGSTGRVLAIIAIVFLAHAPLIFAHFRRLWLLPHYQLFPLVLLGAYALVWPFATFQWKSLGPFGIANSLLGIGVLLVAVGMFAQNFDILIGDQAVWVAFGGLFLFAAIAVSIFTGLGTLTSSHSNPRLGLQIVIFCWFALLVAEFFNSAILAMITAYGVLAATIITLGGKKLFWRCFPALAFLFLLIPPPFGLDTLLVVKLQRFAARRSDEVLDLMGVYHNLSGVTIEVGDKQFEIENACSGISSLLSTITCVLFYVLWCRIHWLRAILLVLACIPWVLFNNIARIVAITFFDVQLGIDLKSGIPHQILGILLFGLTLLLIWSTDRLLMFFARSELPTRRFSPYPVNAGASTSGTQAALSLAGTWYRSIPLGALFAVIFVIQLAEMYAYNNQVPYSGSALSGIYKGIDVGLLPDNHGRWVRGEKIEEKNRPTGNPFGEFSREWRYQNDALRSICKISFDYPYPAYHDLRVCYENIGWNVETPEAFQPQLSSGAPLYCARVLMKRPVERYGALWFCNFDQDGIGLDPDLDITNARTVGERARTRISYEAQRWKRLFFPSQTDASRGIGSILQVQLLYEDTKPVSDSVKKDLESLFVTSAERIRAKCIELKNRK